MPVAPSFMCCAEVKDTLTIKSGVKETVAIKNMAPAPAPAAAAAEAVADQPVSAATTSEKPGPSACPREKWFACVAALARMGLRHRRLMLCMP